MTTKVETKAGEVEWWVKDPVIPRKAPTRATIEFKGPKARKAAKRFAEVLEQVVAAAAPAWNDSRPSLQCVMMQTAGGLRLVTADGFRLAAAEYRPGLMDSRSGPHSPHQEQGLGYPGAARHVLPCLNVRAIANVLKRVSPKGWATLEVTAGRGKTNSGRPSTTRVKAVMRRRAGPELPPLAEAHPDRKGGGTGGLGREISPVGGPLL